MHLRKRGKCPCITALIEPSTCPKSRGEAFSAYYLPSHLYHSTKLCATASKLWELLPTPHRIHRTKYGIVQHSWCCRFNHVASSNYVVSSTLLPGPPHQTLHYGFETLGAASDTSSYPQSQVWKCWGSFHRCFHHVASSHHVSYLPTISADLDLARASAVRSALPFTSDQRLHEKRSLRLRCVAPARHCLFGQFHLYPPINLTAPVLALPFQNLRS